MEQTYQVIVVGAGFAGLTAARKLGRKGVRVLLIDANNYHQFQPLLYQVATSQIGVSAIAPAHPFGFPASQIGQGAHRGSGRSRCSQSRDPVCPSCANALPLARCGARPTWSD